MAHETLLGLAPKEAFLAVYDEIKAFLIADMKERSALDDNRANYLAQLMDTSCLGGKYNRGLTVVEVASALCPGDAAALHAACVCGWSVEFMQSHFLIEDDIMDSSRTRRGKPCWYLHPGVTTQCAINDGLIVLAWATRMLEHYLAGHPRLLTILLLFHRTDFHTTIGQLYDVSSMFDSAKLDPNVAQPTTTDYREFTVAHYKRIVKYKTAFYTYHAPMVLGLAVCDAVDTVDAAVVERLAVTMGEYFQIQDDFLDCFGDPAVIGKIGTDIEDVKCSWLAVTFLDGAAEDQKEAFKANYGQHDADKVAAIKQLYKDADLEGQFATYEATVVESVQADLESLKAQSAPFAAAVASLWGRTFKRTK